MSGSVEFGALLCLGWRWRFGLMFDVYTTGTSGKLGLGPRQLRWYWTSARGKGGERLGFLKWERGDGDD